MKIESICLLISESFLFPEIEKLIDFDSFQTIYAIGIKNEKVNTILKSDVKDIKNIQVVFDLSYSIKDKISNYYYYQDSLAERAQLISTNICSASWLVSNFPLFKSHITIGIYSGSLQNNLIELSFPLSRNGSKEILDELSFIKIEKVVINDIVGGISLRTISCIINEASYALMEGVSSVNDIDLAMQMGTNYPKGPFLWADFIGLDVILSCLDGCYQETLDQRYRAAAILRKKVEVGELGNKTGQGFYPILY